MLYRNIFYSRHTATIVLLLYSKSNYENLSLALITFFADEEI